MRISDWSSDVCSSDLWNRRFAGVWGLEEEFLDEHPRIEALLDHIAKHLAKPAQCKAVGDAVRIATLDRKQHGGRILLADGRRSEERRVGKECVSTCRSRWSPYPTKTNTPTHKH